MLRYFFEGCIYDDDIQTYISFKPNHADALHAVGLLENCMNDVHFGLTLIETELCQMRVTLIWFEDSTM